ncbi:hypothetical protein JCM6882_002974 [Rhodosporidiobolus microsporus]
MSESLRLTLKEAPLIVLRANGTSHLVGTPSTLRAARMKAGVVFAGQLDLVSLRLEVVLPCGGTAIVEESAWLATVSVLQAQTGSPPVFLVEDKDFAVEQQLPPAYTALDDGGATDDPPCELTPLAVAQRGPPPSRFLEVPATRSVVVHELTGRLTRIPLASSDKVATLMLRIRDRTGMPPDQMRLIWKGQQLEELYTLEEYRFGSVEDVYLVPRLRGGKPVIYLFPPTPLPNVQVNLTLSPQWHFSALYPVCNVIKSKDGSSSVVWTVDAVPEGQLVDKENGLDLSYLFWEAEATRSTTPSSAPSLTSNGIPAFDPSNPSLTPSDGAVLSLSLFLPYLDKTLFNLSLHTSARTDFIAFWLPHFNRLASTGKHIAFRFLPQRVHKQAASLEVEPRPDVVTRVFLLFKGVDVSETGKWRKAESVDWVKEVRVDPDEVANEALFRVLEWGGMEVVAV